MNPKVTVVIPNWNGAKFLEPCIRSLEKQSFKAFRVIVVDNNSNDASAEAARSKILSVDFTRLDRNRGFSGAVNVGIRATTTPYVALLNNDTEQDQHWLAELVKALEDAPGYDSAASKMLEFANRQIINAAGDGLSIYGMPFSMGAGQPDGPSFNHQTPVFGASAGAAIYRKSLFDDIGLFDEYFFAYSEDVDICFRAQLAGHTCVYVPTAVAYHHGGGTAQAISGFAQYYTTRNNLLMLTKNLPARLWAKYLLRILLFLGIKTAWAQRGQGGERSLLAPTLRGYAMFFVGLPHALRARRQVQRRRQVSVAYIDSVLYHQFPVPSKPIELMKRWHLVKS